MNKSKIHRLATCDGKNSYPTLKVAVEFAKRHALLSRQGNKKLSAYKCRCCNRLHVGHQDKRLKRNHEDFSPIQEVYADEFLYVDSAQTAASWIADASER